MGQGAAAGAGPASRAQTWLGALVLALGASACRSADARALNLTRLHDERGQHLRTAELVSESSYAVREFLRDLRPGGATFELGRARRVKDPLGACQENLLGLARAAGRDERERALLVRWCVELALRDPWVLTRERAVIELGALGEALDLGLAGPAWRERSAMPAGEAAATPMQVQRALMDLARAAASLGAVSAAQLGALRGQGNESELGLDQAPPELSAACAALAALPFDLDGALRALRGTTELVGRGWRDDGRLLPALQLARELERRCVTWALAAALEDRGGAPAQADAEHSFTRARVRAAAIAACGRAFGAVFVRELCERLSGTWVRGRSPEELEAALAVLARSGLPADASWEERERWLEQLVRLASAHPLGGVRAWSMRALERATHGELSGLREETALAWQAAVRAAMSSGEGL